MRRISVGGTAILAGLAAATAAQAATPIRPAQRATAAMVAAGGRTHLGGLTAQRDPIVMWLAGGRRSVVRADAALELHCTVDGDMTLTDTFERVRIDRHGRFRTDFDSGTVTNRDGSTVRWRDALSGRVNAAGTAVHGAWSLRLDIQDGQTGETCSSGRVRFTLER
jgi:hypothetical protein